MDFLDFLRKLPTPEYLVTWGPYLYVFLTAIIFAETGLLAGFFLPGDSLLFTAGMLVATGNLDIILLNALLISAAIIGDTVGYWIGRKAGPKIFTREKSIFFNKDHLLWTKEFYERHGGKTIIIARFLPIARTFAPVVAGVGQMEYRRFVAYNVFGGIGWVVSLTLAGWALGHVAWVRKNIDLVVLAIIIISGLPVVIEVAKQRRRKRLAKRALAAAAAAATAPPATPTAPAAPLSTIDQR
jgi:membrane-associated protein